MNFNKILTELCWRLENGTPDLKNPKHLDELRAVLVRNGTNPKLIKSLIENLIEMPFGPCDVPVLDLSESGVFVISSTETLTESKAVFDLRVVQKIGGEGITQDSVDKLATMSPGDLLSGSGNTYEHGKSSWALSDIKKVLSKEGQLIMTTAGTVTKIRSKYGERICQLVKSVSNPNTDKHLSRVKTMLTLLQLGVEQVPKVAPGIGYETMQVDNLESWVKDNLGAKATPLKLIVAGKDTGIKINSAGKVTGVPKSDLGFGINGKSNFFISYKHGEMFGSDGKELKASFQQYGSVSSFYNAKFTAQVDGVKGLKRLIESFIEATAQKVSKSSTVYTNVTDCIKKNGVWVLISNGKEVIPEDQNKNLWGSWHKKIKKEKPKKLYVTPAGFSARRSLLSSKAGQLGKDISMMSIFGNNYFTGTAGENNCNILMQDGQAFKIGKKVDGEGKAIAIEMNVSGGGHIMWNPKMYGKKAEFPSFSKQYEPYLVSRYTAANGWKVKDGLVIGARFLVMPASQGRGSDI